MKIPKLLAGSAIIAAGLVLAGCRIDATAPLGTAEILNVAQNGTPTPVAAAITASFASKTWCRDEGAMAISQLGSADVPIQAVSCSAAGDGAEGQFQLTTSLVRTAGSSNPQTVVAEVLGPDLARLAVYPHGKHNHLLSVGIFLNAAQLQQAQSSLLAMPVFKRGGDTGEIATTFSVNVTNTLPRTVKFYLTDVAADNEGGASEAVLELPQGATENIALDPVSRDKLLQNGWVNLFTMDTR
jgi:hypothetical protein